MILLLKKLRKVSQPPILTKKLYLDVVESSQDRKKNSFILECRRDDKLPNHFSPFLVNGGVNLRLVFFCFVFVMFSGLSRRGGLLCGRWFSTTAASTPSSSVQQQPLPFTSIPLEDSPQNILDYLQVENCFYLDFELKRRKSSPPHKPPHTLLRANDYIFEQGRNFNLVSIADYLYNKKGTVVSIPILHFFCSVSMNFFF